MAAERTDPQQWSRMACVRPVWIVGLRRFLGSCATSKRVDCVACGEHGLGAKVRATWIILTQELSSDEDIVVKIGSVHDLSAMPVRRKLYRHRGSGVR